MDKKGILLVNLGTPDSTAVPDVRKYLREFLMDERVIDIPFVNRWLLINFIIAPFRAPKSAREYKLLFTERGSPLKYHTEDLLSKLQSILDENYVAEYAMRYQNPSIESGLEKLRDQNVSSIHVIPLFPQYASASTGSVQQKVMELVSKWQVVPDIKFTSRFFNDDLFLDTIVDNARKLMDQTKYDHFLFSYHGVPERQVLKASVDGYCQLGKCCGNDGLKNHYCYRGNCFATTRLLAKKLGLKEGEYTVSFQSRLGKTPWVKPYTDVVLEDLAKSGVKKVLAFSPSFVSDCLETTVEVGETYRDDFIKAGGEQWDLVPSLNSDDKWVECVRNIAVS